MIQGIHHISMKCDDPVLFERALSFYRDILRLPVIRRWAEGAFIDTGSGFIEIFCNGTGETRKGAIRHVALATDDLDACVRAIEAAGYGFFEGPRLLRIPSSPPLCARIAFCKGPLGEEIELFQEEE